MAFGFPPQPPPIHPHPSGIFSSLPPDIILPNPLLVNLFSLFVIPNTVPSKKKNATHAVASISSASRSFHNGEGLRLGRPSNRARAMTSTTKRDNQVRSEEHTSELQSLMRISYAVFCLKKKKKHNTQTK